MKNLIALLIVGLLPVSVWAQDSQTETTPGAKAGDIKKISAAEAKDHIGKTLIVTGTVAQVTIREKQVYLNLDEKYPQTPFTGVIFARATNGFGDLKKLSGKQVEIRGKIEEYRQKPQIVLNSTSQLTVLAKTPGDSLQK